MARVRQRVKAHAPMEPVEPTEPVDPLEPVVPVGPHEPVEPYQPDEPVEPVEPARPVEPDEPSGPVERYVRPGRRGVPADPVARRPVSPPARRLRGDVSAPWHTSQCGDAGDDDETTGTRS